MKGRILRHRLLDGRLWRRAPLSDRVGFRSVCGGCRVLLGTVGWWGGGGGCGRGIGLLLQPLEKNVSVVDLRG